MRIVSLNAITESIYEIIHFPTPKAEYVPKTDTSNRTKIQRKSRIATNTNNSK